MMKNNKQLLQYSLTVPDHSRSFKHEIDHRSAVTCIEPSCGVAVLITWQNCALKVDRCEQTGRHDGVVCILRVATVLYNSNSCYKGLSILATRVAENGDKKSPFPATNGNICCQKRILFVTVFGDFCCQVWTGLNGCLNLNSLCGFHCLGVFLT